MTMKTPHVVSVVVLLLCLADVCQAQRPRRRPAASQGGSRAATVSTSQYAQHPLIKLIIREQRTYIRDSWGQLDYQCFTSDDLARFKSVNVPRQVTERLKTDAEFLSLVREIGQLSSGARSQLLSRAYRTYRPTWRQLGRISRAGQTVAGQQAERLMAKAIADLVGELLRKQ
jgi:hypothetical protein